MQTRRRWKQPEETTFRAVVSVGEYQEVEEPAYALDPETIRAEELQTVEECAYLMAELDKMRVELGSDLRHAGMKAKKYRQYAPRDWYERTTKLLNAVNVAQNQVQDRRGVIRREKNLAKQEASMIRAERRFVEAARQTLSPDQYQAIWDAANAPGMRDANRPSEAA